MILPESRDKWTLGERAHQCIRFEGLRFENISPTDIDGMLEHNGTYIIYEWKLTDKKMPRGQELALTRLVDDLTRARRHAVLFLCSHDQLNPAEDVEGAEAIVTRVYFSGHWHAGTGRTVKEMTRRFLAFAETCGG